MQFRIPRRASLRAFLPICLLPFVLVSCSGEQDRSGDLSRNAVPTVAVLAVSSRPHASSIEFIGETVAYQKVDIRARVTGFLEERAFAEGGQIAKGDLLYRIDPSEYNAASMAADAGLERAEATLLETGQTLARSRELVAKGTVSQAKLDEAVAAESRSRADVDAAKADVQRANLNLGYTEIRSPIAGRIGKGAVDVGNLIGPDSGILATAVTLNPIRVVFSVSERTFLEVRKAQKEGDAAAFIPRIKLANGEFHKEEGTFLFGDNRVDSSTGTIRVFMEFPNPDEFLVPGMFVNVVLASQDEQQHILVPQSAIQLNQSGPFVLVVNADSRVEVRQVETGQRSGAEIVIVSGLQVGETIITEGIQKVRPGGEVNTVAVPANVGAN